MKPRARNGILKLLADRVPNWVPTASIRSRLREFTADELREALEQLVSDGQVESRNDPRPETGLSTQFYRLRSFKNLPIRETIPLGDVEMPRLMSDSSAGLFPEIYNEALELLAEYNRSLEARFERIVRTQERKYWANVVGLFGVFVSVLALVIVGLPKITTDPTLPFWSVFWLNVAQILPVALVLAVFVLVARWVVR